jgi:hypothetical protein
MPDGGGVVRDHPPFRRARGLMIETGGFWRPVRSCP